MVIFSFSLDLLTSQCRRENSCLSKKNLHITFTITHTHTHTHIYIFHVDIYIHTYLYFIYITLTLTLPKEYSEFKPVKLRLKIDLVSYPARAEGLVNMISNSQPINQFLFLTLLEDNSIRTDFLDQWKDFSICFLVQISIIVDFFLNNRLIFH